MKKKYSPPRIKAEYVKINYFYSRRGGGFNDVEGILLAGCTCVDGVKWGGTCGCS